MSAMLRCNAATCRVTSSAPRNVSRRVVSCRVASYDVTFQTPAGERKSFKCQADKNLLEGALAAGVEVPHLCKTGTCGVCAARVLEGNIERADFLLDDDQREHGFALLCTSTPTSDVVLATEQEKVRRDYCRDSALRFVAVLKYETDTQLHSMCIQELHTIPYGL